MEKQPDNIDQQLKQIGERIRAIRKAKGFSNYEQFAFQHEFNRSSYSRFERGEDMRMSSLLRVLDAFDITLQEFFTEGFEEEED
jgi:Helix-turn-helix.